MQQNIIGSVKVVKLSNKQHIISACKSFLVIVINNETTIGTPQLTTIKLY